MIPVMPSHPFTVSKAAYRGPRCYDRLSPLLAQKPESSCVNRWVRPCRVSTPLAPWSSRFRAWIPWRSLELFRNQAGRDGGARRGSPFPLHRHAASRDAVPTNVPREMRAKVMNA
jgi:hypothetical protein